MTRDGYNLMLALRRGRGPWKADFAAWVVELAERLHGEGSVEWNELSRIRRAAAAIQRKRERKAAKIQALVDGP